MIYPCRRCNNTDFRLIGGGRARRCSKVTVQMHYLLIRCMCLEQRPFSCKRQPVGRCSPGSRSNRRRQMTPAVWQMTLALIDYVTGSVRMTHEAFGMLPIRAAADRLSTLTIGFPLAPRHDWMDKEWSVKEAISQTAQSR